ncbi:MAG: BlaI/MecI/CopY family transcriptional regulator [Bacteroidota bacterium]
MTDSKIKPTEKELEILQALWSMGPSTVRAVNEFLSVSNAVGYTTTLKLMQIMFDKGILDRKKQGKTHVYQPLISEETTQQQLLDKLLNTAFRGSAMKLVMQALGNQKSSKKELDQIRAYLDKLEDDNEK